MQNLRDKLLKSGLVDKKTARKAKTEVRRNKKQKGARVDAAEREARKERFEQQRAEAAEAAREQAIRLNEQRERKERSDRLRNIIERHCLRRLKGDLLKFYFVGPDRRIRRLATNFEVGDRLGRGELAIVSAPYDDRRGYRLVERAIAERIEELDPSYLLFWNRDPGDVEQGPTYGATGPVAEMIKHNGAVNAARTSSPPQS